MRIDFYEEDFGGSKPKFSIENVDAIYHRQNKELVIRLTTGSDGYVWSPDDYCVIHYPADEDDDCLDEFDELDRQGLYRSYVVRS